MYSLKPIARPAAILLKSTLLMGLLATTSITTAHEAAAARGCLSGQTRYNGKCMPYWEKGVLERAKKRREAAAAAAQPPMCPVQLPITGQVVNLPCPTPAPSTGKTCPFTLPIGGQVVQVPC